MPLHQIEEPICFEDASKFKEWCTTMDKERKALERNRTWELVDLPKKKEVVELKSIYKVKFHVDRTVQKYKARLIAHGYMQ